MEPHEYAAYCMPQHSIAFAIVTPKKLPLVLGTRDPHKPCLIPVSVSYCMFFSIRFNTMPAMLKNVHLILHY